MKRVDLNFSKRQRKASRFMNKLRNAWKFDRHNFDGATTVDGTQMLKKQSMKRTGSSTKG